MLPPLQSPPAVVAPAPSSLEAETALLDAFDWGQALPPLPKLKGPATLDHRWLRAAATFAPGQGLPANPFLAGAGKREAEAFRQLTSRSGAALLEALKAQPLRHSGTALALWRWGQRQVRNGVFSPALRQAWEDRLLAAGPALTRGYALRHALCWALAEQDEARFAAIRSKVDQETLEALKGFQRLFGLLGGPSPALRLWSLPGLDYRDAGLESLGAQRVWICPAEGGALPEIPASTTWIIPSDHGSLDERDASLTGTPLAEAQALVARLRSAGRAAYFAPSRMAFERLGLAWFPALIELDAQGNIRSIRMGDAAPARP